MKFVIIIIGTILLLLSLILYCHTIHIISIDEIYVINNLLLIKKILRTNFILFL